ncbi:hypothetical protein V6Z77_002313 [Aspergillus fumigatus]
MKLSSAFIIGFLPLTLARSILVTYPQDTPDSVIKDAQKSIVEGGGHITHEYRKCCHSAINILVQSTDVSLLQNLSSNLFRSLNLYLTGLASNATSGVSLRKLQTLPFRVFLHSPPSINQLSKEIRWCRPMVIKIATAVNISCPEAVIAF